MVTQNMLSTHEEKLYVFLEEQKRYVTALDLIKCFRQIIPFFIVRTVKPPTERDLRQGNP